MKCVMRRVMGRALAFCLGALACTVAAGQAPAPLKSAVVELREVDDTVSADAVVEAARQSTVSAQIAGRVVELRFDLGDYVKQGEVIVRIDSRAVTQAAAASEAQVTQAQAELANARAQLERTRALVAQKFLSPSALDKAEADAKAAAARVSALLAGAGVAQTERSFATVVAPYSGVVAARHVELGEMAAPGKPLMTGFDPSSLRVVATVPQSQIAAIQAGARARIEVPSANAWFDAASVTVLPLADTRTHTVQVRLNLKDDALKQGARGLLPGVFARVHFSVGKVARLLVPQEAIVRRSEVTAVYVLDAQGAPQLRQVRLGAAQDERSIEVLAGLKPGERVALEPLAAGTMSPR